MNKNLDSSFIIGMINAMVIGSFVQFTDRYKTLQSILDRSKSYLTSWDFFMTVGGAGLYLVTIKVTKEEFEKELEIVNDKLYSLNKEMPTALHNFWGFMIKPNLNEEEMITSVGIWVLWNIAGSPPAFDECKELAPAIGNYLHHLIIKLIEIDPTKI